MKLMKLAGLLLILPIILVILSNIAGLEALEGIDWTGENVTWNQRYIERNLDGWRRDSLAFGLYGISQAVAVMIFAIAVRQNPSGARHRFLAIAGAVLVSIGAATWMYVSYSRATLPPAVVAQNLNTADWTMPTMGISFILGTLFLGFTVFLRYSKWGGGLILAFVTALFVFSVYIEGEVIPAAYILALAIAGIVLLFLKEPNPQPESLLVKSDQE